ncbi:alpha/beta family hydrolase [Nostocoides sp. Soil756]|uniref:alpha/beta hydrolase family protein n=1 Tax=Nostocoides sp. Soil756 TaxID=1736399 RepID=UPI0012F72690|nr:alpha/beta family hydrolase [Tetrasphaera sp. Soil756]
MSVALVATPRGSARTTTDDPGDDPVGTLVLGHGAGGLRWTADVLAVRDAALEAGWRVVLVDQPWRVEGRRVGPGPASLDPAWLAVLASVPRRGPLVVGGRSAGARVACRTAATVGADAVLALSFPLHPPGRPDRSRAEELRRPAAQGIAVHVVQGDADPFGTPDELRAVLPAGAGLDVVGGAHSLERAAPEVAAAAVGLLWNVRGAGDVPAGDSIP